MGHGKLTYVASLGDVLLTHSFCKKH